MNKIQLLLTQLAEECGEVTQMCSKSIRFGLDEIYPVQDKTNAQRLYEEIVDIISIIELLKEEGVFHDCEDYVIDSMVEKKKEKVEKYMKYSVELGNVTLSDSDKKVSTIQVRSYKDTGLHEIWWELFGQHVKSDNEDDVNEKISNIFEYGEYVDMDVVVDENLNIVGGKIIPKNKK